MCMQNKHASQYVKFWQWKDFKNAVCTGKGGSKKLCEADLVVGGAYLAGDYM